MKSIDYSFRESRITVKFYSGEAAQEHFNVNIDIESITHKQVDELRRFIDTFCRGESQP